MKKRSSKKSKESAYADGFADGVRATLIAVKHTVSTSEEADAIVKAARKASKRWASQ